jgi:hypothetical protein
METRAGGVIHAEIALRIAPEDDRVPVELDDFTRTPPFKL